MPYNRTPTFNGKKINEDMQKHAVDWSKGVIGTTQLQTHFGKKSITVTLYRAALALREAVRSGLLK